MESSPKPPLPFKRLLLKVWVLYPELALEDQNPGLELNPSKPLNPFSKP